MAWCSGLVGMGAACLSFPTPKGPPGLTQRSTAGCETDPTRLESPVCAQQHRFKASFFVPQAIRVQLSGIRREVPVPPLGGEGRVNWGGDEVGRPPLCHSKEAVKPEVPPGKHRQV